MISPEVKEFRYGKPMVSAGITPQMVKFTYLSWFITNYRIFEIVYIKTQHGDYFDGKHDQKLEQQMIYSPSVIMDGNGVWHLKHQTIWVYSTCRVKIGLDHHIYIHIHIYIHYVTLQYSTSRCVTLHYSAVQYSISHYISLHYSTFQYVTLHDMTLHNTIQHCITSNTS